MSRLARDDTALAGLLSTCQGRDEVVESHICAVLGLTPKCRYRSPLLNLMPCASLKSTTAFKAAFFCSRIILSFPAFGPRSPMVTNCLDQWACKCREPNKQ